MLLEIGSLPPLHRSYQENYRPITWQFLSRYCNQLNAVNSKFISDKTLTL